MEPGTVWTFYHLEGGGAGLSPSFIWNRVLHSDYRRTAQVENCESLVRLEYQSQMTFHVSSAGTKCNGQKDYKPWYSLLKETHNMLKFGSSPFASDPSGQLNVLGHDGHPLGVDSLQAEFKKQ